jgi:pullulanase
LRDRLEEATKATEKERLRMVKLAQTAVYVSQGIPFIFNGEELYRHKQGVKNSYNKPDSINAIDWGYKKTYKDLVDYYAELAKIRKAHPAFCLADAEAVRKHLEFIDTQDELVSAFTLKGIEGVDKAKSIVVVLNGSKKTKEVSIPKGKYVILAHDGVADSEGLGTYSGDSFKVKPTSATILAEM